MIDIGPNLSEILKLVVGVAVILWLIEFVLAKVLKR